MISARPCTIALLLIAVWALPAAAQGDAKRGEYLAKAGGCLGCHTAAGKDAVPYAGGRELKTPFGTFFGPNLTPHPEAGIGRWAEADFIKAMREGRRPDGAHYYPAFPYPSFTGIRDADLRDLWAYLRTLPPSDRANRGHDLPFYLQWRFLLTFWKWLYFTPGSLADMPGASAAVNRGAYLVRALGHCGECHTPRNVFGAMKDDRFLAGTESASNLTPANLKRWSDEELKNFLTTGTTAEGDVPAEEMGEVITNTTSQLTPQDLSAMIAYLRSLPPIADKPERR